MFVSAWKAWTHNGPAAQVPVSDVSFQYAKLRLDGVDWSPPALSVLFDEPGIKIDEFQQRRSGLPDQGHLQPVEQRYYAGAGKIA